MTYTVNKNTPQTCANCPLAQKMDRDRYECLAVHNHHTPVVRGHWEATADCNEAVDDLTQPVGASPEAIFCKETNELETAATKHGLDFVSLLDEGNTCLRLSKNGTYLGSITVENDRFIVSRAGDRNKIKTRFTKGAVSLIVGSMPAIPKDKATVSEETSTFMRDRDQKMADILSGKKSRGW